MHHNYFDTSPIDLWPMAMSAGNQQPWHFIVIRDRSTLDKITQVHPHAKMLKEAPMAVAVCAEPALEKHSGYWVQDCSAATENFLLAARAMGYGTVWLGCYPREDRMEGLKALFNLPEGVIPFCVIAVGVAAEDKASEDRLKPERIHNDRW